ncbi:MAG: hypothetical protein IPM57_11240 [Oligoflexia bacterium]|nr:hypothetical protein [Oligoflexia bacterium]
MISILISLLCSQSLAISSINSTASFGYFRDEQQNAHVPLIYSFNYVGLDANGNQAYLDFFVNNDFMQSQWQVNASQASLVFPLSKKTKSRVQLGRQLFLEGFDLYLLDGIQLPLYWSATGGVWFYGGNLKVLDLLDSTSSTLAGLSVFEQLYNFNLRAGYTNKQFGFGSISKVFDDIVFSPFILTKQEYDQNSNSWSQSLNELGLSLTNDFYLTLTHSLRNPRTLSSNANNFVYYVLSQSAQEMYQAGIQYNIFTNLDLQLLSRTLRYKTGTQMESAYQQEFSLSWAINTKNILSPVLGHILGYGGELWDTGVLLKSELSEKTSLKNELSAAYLNKVNNITGWAYQVRSGINYELAYRWLSSVWVEVERNHLFIFDARILASVTYFN